MERNIKALLTLAALMIVPIVANATLVGSSVTGTLFTPVTNTTTNYFDPAHGEVPPGYGNSAGTTVTIGNPVVEFGWLQGGGTVAAPGIDSIAVNFSGTMGTTVTLTENINAGEQSGVSGFQTVLTDPAFTGLWIRKISDNFAQGGVNASLVGDQLTLTVGGSACISACTWPASQTAKFSLSPVPKETITFEVTGILTQVQDSSDLSFSVPVAVGDTITYDYTVNTETPQSDTLGGIPSAIYQGAIISASFRINGGSQIPITMVPSGLDPFVSLASGFNTNINAWEDDYQAGISGVILGSDQVIVGGVQLQRQDATAGEWPFFLSGITLNTVPSPLSAAGSAQIYLNTNTNSIVSNFKDVKKLDVPETPYVAPGVSGTLGANGWYVSPTTLTWYVTGTPAPTKSGCSKVTVPNTTGTTYTCSATNTVGSASNLVTVKRDTVKPSVVITTPASGATYALNSVVLASYTCADTTSGVASCSGTRAVGTKIPTATIGTHNFHVEAIDNAGNRFGQTVSYTIQ
jgi:hypothetical protein